MDYVLVTALLTGLLVAAAFLSIRLWLQTRDLKRKYQPVVDVETEIKLARQNLEQEKQVEQLSLAKAEQRRAELDAENKEAFDKCKKLQNDISALEENLEDISFGFYKPHFSFQTSEDYKAALEKVRNEERKMIRDKRAVICPVRWTVSNSAADGKRMVNQYMKLMLRAFNGESDAAVANVSWNNISKMQERLRKAFDLLNDLGSVMQVSSPQNI